MHGSINFWDLRTKGCVISLVDKSQYSISCLQYDDLNYRLVAGTSYHSAIRVYDPRMERKYRYSFYVQDQFQKQNENFIWKYWRSKGNIFSICFDNSHLFAALSNSLYKIAMI